MHLFGNGNIIPKVFYKINSKIMMSTDELNQIKNLKDDKGEHERITSDGKKYILSDRMISLLKNSDDTVIDTNSETFEQLLNYVNSPVNGLTMDEKHRFDLHRIFSVPGKQKYNLRQTSGSTTNNKIKKSHNINFNDEASDDYLQSSNFNSPQYAQGLNAFIFNDPQITMHNLVYRRTTGTNVIKYYPPKIPIFNEIDDDNSKNNDKLVHAYNYEIDFGDMYDSNDQNNLEKDTNILHWKISNDYINENYLASIEKMIIIHNEIDDFTQYIENITICIKNDDDINVEIINLSGKGIYMINYLLQYKKEQHKLECHKTCIPFLPRQKMLYYALCNNNLYMDIKLTLNDSSCENIILYTEFSGIRTPYELQRFKNEKHQELVMEAREYIFSDKMENISGEIKGLLCSFEPSNAHLHNIGQNINNDLWMMRISEDDTTIDVLNKKYNHDPYDFPDNPIYLSEYSNNLLNHQPDGLKSFTNATFNVTSSVNGMTRVLAITYFIMDFRNSTLEKHYVYDTSIDDK